MSKSRATYQAALLLTETLKMHDRISGATLPSMLRLHPDDAEQIVNEIDSKTGITKACPGWPKRFNSLPVLLDRTADRLVR